MFLPKKIKVGFQKRKGTYSGKLGYVIYYDEVGKLRKEKSFESWRSKDIEALEFNNEPIEGFVLNKKVGGYSTGWNHRSTYIRVYDPRGFEVEISVSNLLYILRDCYCHPGKGLEGKFIYAWDGKELLLLSTAAKEYTEHLEKTKSLDKGKVENKDLKEGHIYNDAKGESFIYLGRQWFSYFDSYFSIASGKTYRIFIKVGEEKKSLENMLPYLLYDLKNLYGGEDLSEDFTTLKNKINELAQTKRLKEFDTDVSLDEEYTKIVKDKDPKYIQSKEDFIENCPHALISSDKKTLYILTREICYGYPRHNYHYACRTYHIDNKGRLHVEASTKYVTGYKNVCSCGRKNHNLVTYTDLKKDYKECTLVSSFPKLILEDDQPRGN